MPSLLACFVCGGKGESDDVRVLDYRHSALSDVPADVFASERTLEELLLDSNQVCPLGALCVCVYENQRAVMLF